MRKKAKPKPAGLAPIERANCTVAEVMRRKTRKTPPAVRWAASCYIQGLGCGRDEAREAVENAVAGRYYTNVKALVMEARRRMCNLR